MSFRCILHVSLRILTSIAVPNPLRRTLHGSAEPFDPVLGVPLILSIRDALQNVIQCGIVRFHRVRQEQRGSVHNDLIGPVDDTSYSTMPLSLEPESVNSTVCPCGSWWFSDVHHGVIDGNIRMHFGPNNTRERFPGDSPVEEAWPARSLPRQNLSRAASIVRHSGGFLRAADAMDRADHARRGDGSRRRLWVARVRHANKLRQNQRHQDEHTGLAPDGILTSFKIDNAQAFTASSRFYGHRLRSVDAGMQVKVGTPVYHRQLPLEFTWQSSGHHDPRDADEPVEHFQKIRLVSDRGGEVEHWEP